MGVFKFYVVRAVHFGMKLYDDQLNEKFLIYFIYEFTSALHASGFILAHLQRQAYNFGMVSALGR
jgi:hypothetical protein